MKLLHKLGLPAMALLAALPAQAEIWKCVGADGHVTYTNAKSESRGCKVLSQDQPVSTIPGGRLPAPAASFPKVDADAQRARDSERRKILEQELASEQKHLEQARQELGEQEATVLPQERNVGGTINLAKVEVRLQSYKDRVALHERNIESLKKEIGNLK